MKFMQNVKLPVLKKTWFVVDLWTDPIALSIGKVFEEQFATLEQVQENWQIVLNWKYPLQDAFRSNHPNQARWSELIGLHPFLYKTYDNPQKLRTFPGL